MEPIDVHVAVREFALGLPGAYEEFPWGESVAKVNKKVFVFLGADDGSRPPAFNVKLKDPDTHAHALSLPGAERMGYGLGQHGWVYVPFSENDTPVELLCDWIEESYRLIAPKNLVAALDDDVR
ncbi:MmcQ/YjbR family DNA-binding protein [Phytoactinopolyspora endophytica]|uniref:MmcQ/YjbR family DNA-binding protein n=1 Tax=Phytoactinopolyspora endophytica TaxID=1642495 RepID=UPI00197C2B29|nr:MmcQ/YjbR family DNA-binding protein [Phytoactinopolyspora endophytica]